MTEQELAQRLRAVRPPDEALAAERTWSVIRAVHRAAVRQPVARSRWRVPVPAVAGLAVVAILGLTFAIASAPRQAVARWVRDALGLTRLPPARPTLGPLPTGGQVLVTTPTGVWVVNARGARRRLTAGGGASFSPHSLYVAVWRGHELTTVDLRGRRQWALSAGSSVSGVRWSPDGYRIVYLAGRSIMVVAGDGSGAHALPGRAAALAPAWQPATGVAHRVAYLDAGGAIELRDADTGALVWSVRVRERPSSCCGRPTAAVSLCCHGVSSPCIPAPGGSLPPGGRARARSSPAARSRPVTRSRC